MALNDKQQAFVDSIKFKIKEYGIPITLMEALDVGTNRFVETKYNDGSTELVDVDIERELCTRSPNYFLSKYAVFKVVGVGVIPYKPYYFQSEVLKDLPTLKKTVFIKSRQVGISTTTALYCLWKCLFNHGETIVIISKTQKATSDYMDTVRPTLDYIPQFLSQDVTLNNQKELRFNNKSRMVCEAASENAGRSNSASLLILDEAAFYKTDRLIRKIVASAMPALVASNGDLIVISTPNGMTASGTWYYEQVQSLKVKGNNMREKLVEIEWWNVPDRKNTDTPRGYNDKLQEYEHRHYYRNPLVFKDAKEFFKPIEKDWRSNAWLKAAHEDLGDTLFKQEILHSFTITDQTVFDEATIERVANMIKEYTPVETDTLINRSCKGLTIWNYPVPKKRYILASDVAKGSGKDNSSIQILDAETYEQVAEYQGKIQTTGLGKLIRKLALYYNEAYVVVETNSIGEAVFNELYYHEQTPYENIYKQKITRNGITVFTGWQTTAKSRDLIINNFIDFVNNEDMFSLLTIKSPRFLQEMITWVHSDSGRIDHLDSGHDDLLIAYCLALFLRNKATHFGNSFIITEEGNTIDPHTTQVERTLSYEQEAYQHDMLEQANVQDMDTYNWLLGK